MQRTKKKRRRKWKIDIESKRKRGVELQETTEGIISNRNKKIRKENILSSLVETNLAQAGVVCDNEVSREEVETSKEGLLHNIFDSNIYKCGKEKPLENFENSNLNLESKPEKTNSSLAENPEKFFKIFQFTASLEGGGRM